MYQIETILVPVLDQNEQAQSYTQLKIDKLYIALNTETYITLQTQELNMCKKIGYEYYREELFVVQSKTRYSCTSTIYFNLEPEIIKENCEFEFHYNKTDVKPTVLDGAYQIILANWSSYKKIMCAHNNNIPVSIPSHLYVLVNRSILCNCDVEVEGNFLLKSLAACGNLEAKTDLEMYFTVNFSFVNYFDDTIEDLGIPVLKNWTTQEQILPISIETFEFDPNLLSAPKRLEDLVTQYKNIEVNSKNKRIKRDRRSKEKLQIWLFSKKFLGRCASLHSSIDNNDYNDSSDTLQW